MSTMTSESPYPPVRGPPAGRSLALNRDVRNGPPRGARARLVQPQVAQIARGKVDRHRGLPGPAGDRDVFLVVGGNRELEHRGAIVLRRGERDATDAP